MERERNTGKEVISPEFRSVFSLEPLLAFWRTEVTPRCEHMARMFASFEERIKGEPGLQGAIEDFSLLERFQDLVIPLMSVVFPAAQWETEIAAAVVPYSIRPVHVTPRFRRLLMSGDNSLLGSAAGHEADPARKRPLRAFSLILDRVYGIQQKIDMPAVLLAPDPETDLERYYRIDPDLRFVAVKTMGEPPKLTAKDRETILENIADQELLARFMPPERFEFQGFTVLRAVDVTESEVLSAIEKDLIHQESIFSRDGFKRLEHRLKVLFGRQDLMAAMGAIQGDQVLVINPMSQTAANCVFANSNHIPMADVEGSVWMRAVEQGSLVRVPDLSREAALSSSEERVLALGIRSMVISPLFYRGEAVGTLQIMSPRPSDFGPLDAVRMEQIAPLFSVAFRRALDDLENKIQGIIKEKCTAVHPSVEWRFRKAALQHMEGLHSGQASEMEPIVFKDVIPFFAQTDIRGSSEARNRGIQADLMEQLGLAKEVMKWAGKTSNWPLLQEIEYQIDRRMEAIKAGVTSTDESGVSFFLRDEVEPVFDELMELGPRVRRAIKAYRAAIDPSLGVVYRMRRAYEESVSKLNERLSRYLDREETQAQALFPHYFEKHQTDGIDYVIYVGASMTETDRFSRFHVRNLGLWQLMVACGMARETEEIKPALHVPLDTCHLILVNRTPLAIRFRYDEKRFDVDGAYDARHEIIKSRIDKAMVKGRPERLTQPGRVAVVFAHSEEGQEIQRHIEFLQARGDLLNDLERLDLEDLPGVRGLKALRVGVNLKAHASGQPIEKGVLGLSYATGGAVSEIPS